MAKNIGAFVLGTVGSLLVLFPGLGWALLGTELIAKNMVPLASVLGVYFWAFPIFGIVTLIGAFQIKGDENKISWGWVLLVLGFLSLFGVVTALGAFLLMVAGAMTLAE